MFLVSRASSYASGLKAYLCQLVDYTMDDIFSRFSLDAKNEKPISNLLPIRPSPAETHYLDSPVQ
jgi:hypothetical protein